jgi:hypothetical protein
MKGSEKKRRRIERCRRGGIRKSKGLLPVLHGGAVGGSLPLNEGGTRRRMQRTSLRKRVVRRGIKGEKVRRVGTEKRSGAIRSGREGIEGVETVTEYWVSGILTNKGGLGEQAKAGAAGKKRAGERPALVVLRNVKTQNVPRWEALRCGIPTAGRVTSSTSKSSEGIRTYGRPWMGRNSEEDLMAIAEEEKQGTERRVNRRKKARVMGGERKAKRKVPQRVGIRRKGPRMKGPWKR